MPDTRERWEKAPDIFSKRSEGQRQSVDDDGKVFMATPDRKKDEDNRVSRYQELSQRAQSLLSSDFREDVLFYAGADRAARRGRSKDFSERMRNCRDIPICSEI